MVRYFSSTAVRTSLTADVTAVQTTLALASVTGFPAQFPFTLVLDMNTVNEELVDVTGRTGSVVTVVRGVDGTTAVAHASGAVVEHGVSGRDFADAQAHMGATSDVHGVSGALVGAATSQTLTNKTINGGSNSLSNIPLSAVNFPSGGSDGDALVKSGSTMAWGSSGPPRVVGATAPSNPVPLTEWLDTSQTNIRTWRMWNGFKWVEISTTSTLAVPNIGDAVYGGYMAGVIDTTRSGSVLGTDYYQAGLRYALIVSPKSIEYTYGLMYKTSNDAAPAQTRTKWNGLGATEAMYNAGSAYQAATYCWNLTYPTTDGGSRWYLPARDELELLYRNFKPTTEASATSYWNSDGGSFPLNGAQCVFGVNASSDPSGTAYGTGPAQTSIQAFRSGGAQALEGATNPYYWSSTEYNASNAWYQNVGGSYAGGQSGLYKTYTLIRVRPVRRVVL